MGAIHLLQLDCLLPLRPATPVLDEGGARTYWLPKREESPAASGFAMKDDDESRMGGVDGLKQWRVVLLELTYTVQSRKDRKKLRLLDNVSAYAEPYQLTALMGPSGSGKTTLLDVLAGRKTAGAISGEIRLGHAKPSAAFLRRHTGYVEQFDSLIANLTVAEMLMYTAELKRSMSEPRSSKQAMVCQLLERLSLTACADTVIGDQLTTGISGGEAKRTNIGIALVAEPCVLFLDEPTSGLDSFTANEVVALLQRLSRDGTTIMTTIHTPTATAFAMFDVVLMLVQGQLVYFGPCEATMEFARTHWDHSRQHLSHVDNGQMPLAEFLVDIITEASRANKGAELAAVYQASDLCRENEARVAAYVHGGGGCSKDVLTSSSVDTAAHAAAVSAVVVVVVSPSPSTQDLCASPRQDDAQAKRVYTHSSSLLSTETEQDVQLSMWAATVTPWWWGLIMLLRYRTGTNLRSPAWLVARTADKVFICSIVVTLYFQSGSDFDRLVNMSAALFMWCSLPAFGAVAYMPSIITERKLFYREHADGLYLVVTYLLAKMLEELTMTVPASLALAAAVFYGVGYQGSFMLFWLTCMITHTVGIALSYLVAALAPTMDVANAMLPAYVTGLLFLAGQLATLDTIPVYWRWFSRIDFVRYAWCALMANQFHEVNPPFTALGVTILEYYSITPGGQWKYFSLLFAFLGAYAFLAYLALAYVRHGAR